MAKEVVETGKAPTAIGPYSQAIRVGNLVFTAGQIAIIPATGQLIPGGIAEQTARALENLQAILGAAGTSLDRAVKATVYLKDFNDFMAMNVAYGNFMGKNGAPPPARTTVEVSRLPKDALIEIEVVAEI